MTGKSDRKMEYIGEYKVIAVHDSYAEFYRHIRLILQNEERRISIDSSYEDTVPEQWNILRLIVVGDTVKVVEVTKGNKIIGYVIECMEVNEYLKK